MYVAASPGPESTEAGGMQIRESTRAGGPTEAGGFIFI